MTSTELRLERPIKLLIEATNKGDNAAFVANFVKDGAINDWGQVHSGRLEISAWDKAENTGTGRKLKVTGVSRLAGEVLVLLQVTERVERTKGADPDDEPAPTSTTTFSFRLRGDKIALLEIG